MDSTLLKEVKYMPNKFKYELNIQEMKPKNVKKPDTLYLLAVVIGGAMLAVLSGVENVWTSSVIPLLKSNNTEENPIGRSITTIELSMLAGLPSLSMLFGIFIHGYLSEKIGRKRTLEIAGAGIFISVVSTAFSTQIILMIIFQCALFCFSYGAMTVYPVYITEICEDHNRAKYGCLNSVFLPTGNLLGYGLGALFQFRNFTLIGLFPIVVFLLFCVFAPESPVYSLSRNRKEECIRTLRKLRSNKNETEIQEDFHRIEATIEAKATAIESNIFSIFKTKERRYSAMLSSVLTMVYMFSGIRVILGFMKPIFLETGSKFDSSQLPIWVAAVKIPIFVLTSSIIEKVGRRTMLLISSTTIGVPLFVLGIFFHLKAIGSPVIPQLQWLPLVCIMSFIILFSLGLGPVPFAIIGEFFMPDSRAAGLSIAMTSLGISAFCLTSTFPILLEKFGMQWCMWLYSIFCVLGAVFIYVYIPETKGKSFIEIQEYIKSRCEK